VLDAIKARSARRRGARTLLEPVARWSTRSPRSTACKPANIVLGCGSTQILRSATHLFTREDKALVGTIPTYEECAGYADMMGIPSAGRARPDFNDRSRTAGRRGQGAGLVFYCNPNNPTRPTSAPGDARLPARVNRDLAGHDDSRRRGVLRLRAPIRITTRTSRRRREPAHSRRAHVLQGVRHGGPPDWLRRRTRGHDQKMADWDGGSGTSSLNVLSMHAATAAVVRTRRSSRSERARNTEVRDFTMKWFSDRGMKPTDSQANFMFVNIGRPVAPFREACAAKGVRVARNFRRSKTRTAASRSARWKRCRRRWGYLGEVLGKTGRLPPLRSVPGSGFHVPGF
jgi:hypothetical protein